MVLPSVSEGFPNVVLEAMAAGVFVVAAPTGGTPELVKDGENGLLTDGVSPEELAEGIRKYLCMEVSAREGILCNAGKWIERFDKERAFEPNFELYERI